MGLKINTALKSVCDGLIETAVNSEGGLGVLYQDSDDLQLLCCWLKLKLPQILR